MKKKDKEVAIKVKELMIKDVELSVKMEEFDKVVVKCYELKILLVRIKGEAKKFNVISVLEARLNMMDDTEESKMDFWDREKWQKALKWLKGEEGWLDDGVYNSMKDFEVEEEDIESSSKE